MITPLQRIWIYSTLLAAAAAVVYIPFQPIEETGNLLILCMDLYRCVGYRKMGLCNTPLLSRVMRAILFKMASTLIPNSQLMMLFAQQQNQTNLVIKATVGLKAFGALRDQHNYTQWVSHSPPQSSQVVLALTGAKYTSRCNMR
jgi:hypothetical protein